MATHGRAVAAGDLRGKEGDPSGIRSKITSKENQVAKVILDNRFIM